MTADAAFAQRLLDRAARRFGTAEVFEETSETLSVEFADNRLKTISTRQVRGVGLRIVAEGRIGFASTTDLRDPDTLLDMAAASATYGDEARFSLPATPEVLPEVATCDPAVAGVTADQLVHMGRQCLALSRGASDDYLFGTHLSRSMHTQRILNTAGLDLAIESSAMSGDVEVQQVGAGGLLQIYDYRAGARPFDSLADLARGVLEQMRLAARTVPTRTEALPFVFAPKSVRVLLQPLEMALNGKLVHKGSSILRDKLGERVLGGNVTIVDDPTIAYGPASTPLDDEGTPTARRPLFDAGVVTTFMTDLQTAALLDTAPSGHGYRSYSARPSPGTSNVVVEPGETATADMLAGMGRGVIVEQVLGAGQSNMLAGEFSVNVELGFLVEDGRITGRVKDAMVAGNAYDALNHVEAVGSEPKWLGSLCTPPLLVSGLKLAARD